MKSFSSNIHLKTGSYLWQINIYTHRDKQIDRQTHARTHTHTHTHTNTRAHTHTHTYARARAYTHARTYIKNICSTFWYHPSFCLTYNYVKQWHFTLHGSLVAYSHKFCYIFNVFLFTLLRHEICNRLN